METAFPVSTPFDPLPAAQRWLPGGDSMVGVAVFHEWFAQMAPYFELDVLRNVILPPAAVQAHRPVFCWLIVLVDRSFAFGQAFKAIILLSSSPLVADQADAMLVVEKGVPGIRAIPLDRQVCMLGAAPDCDIFVDNPYVSRMHAQIVRQGDKYRIRDLDSKNGTYVNGTRIKAEGQELQCGD